MLSAIAHGPRADQKEVFEALLAALEVVDHYHATRYADLVLAVPPAAARDYLDTWVRRPDTADEVLDLFDEAAELFE